MLVSQGSVASRDVVLVRPSWPVDGAPATVHVLSLRAAAAHLPDAADLAAFPGPLLRGTDPPPARRALAFADRSHRKLLAGVTHKKSVIDYCNLRIRNAEREGARDVTGYVLIWDLLALMLRQNGVNRCRLYYQYHTSGLTDVTY